jgi:transposase-like protein
VSVINIINRFPNQQTCIEHLENIRFADEPFCPLCGVVAECVPKRENNLVGRWNCHACKASFNVLSGTVFQGTHVPLQKWFVAIELMLNAKKSLSSPQLARDAGLTQPTALFVQKRIRAEMASKQGKTLLQGIVEADETYVGGKPRKGNKRKNDKPSKRGRGTDKTPVIGAVERGGNVVARVADDLTGKGVLSFIKETVTPEGSLLITDEYKAYNAVRKTFAHDVISHAHEYVRNGVHTNTIEGVWSLLKRAWYGSHHHYSKNYTPLYVAEAAYKYNARKDDQIFNTFLNGCFA